MTAWGKLGIVVVVTAVACLLTAGWGEEAQETPGASGPAPRIQVAILLDTSGSMSGLIEQAKTHLWTIVNEFARMKKDGRAPVLEIALYEYGKSSIPAKEGYIRMIVPLTTDLDKVYEELFPLRTNGGDEYCGQVIQSATQGLAWSESDDDFKAIFIAGNEPFTQGKVDYRKACRTAIGKGIMVNTIFCGPHATGVATNWKDGALLADGSYVNIDQDRKLVHVESPQDETIARLDAELNSTYVPFGAKGEAGRARQTAQDANAQSLSAGVAAQRAAAKASGQYRNAGWDLVDAVREGQVKLAEVKSEDLPEAMKEMTTEEQKAYIESQAQTRAKLQQEIGKLAREREKYVAQERRELAGAGGDTLDAVIVQTVRQQAGERNFKVE